MYGEQTTAKCWDWSAVHDRMPLEPWSLRVHGSCEFPTAGYSVDLRRHEPQGINPRDLLLDLVVHEPSGTVAQVFTTVEARYEEETDFEYESVTVLPDGPSIPVQKVR